MARAGGPHNQLSYVAGVLAWLVPGLGHWRLGMRVRGLLIFGAIMGLFVSGLAVGSIYVVHPKAHQAWFIAQVLAGLPTLVVAMLSSHFAAAAAAAAGSAATKIPGLLPVVQTRGFDIGQIYVGVAGLLNLLCILDAIFRSQMPAEGAEQTHG